MTKCFTLILFSPLFFVQCSDTKNNGDDQKQTIGIKNGNTDTLLFLTKRTFPEDGWKLISKIDFLTTSKIRNLTKTPTDTLPWVNIANPNTFNLINADELVLKYRRIRLVIDYPLTTTAVFEMTTEKQGFSRSELISIISKKYHRIYSEEEKTMTNSASKSVRTIENRQETNGKYGICCHDITDLDVSEIDVYEVTGEIYLILSIES